MISLNDFLARNPEHVGWGEMDFKTYAPRLLPYLIWCANKRKLMTYGDMAKNVKFPPKYRQGSALSSAAGNLVGFMGEYCKANKLPPLNALIVNKQDLFPSTGFAHYPEKYGIEDYNTLSIEEKQQVLSNKIYPLIFQPGIWLNLLEINDIKPQEPKFTIPYRQEPYEEINGIQFLPSQQKVNTGESDEHKILKKYVIENCENIENLRLLGCKKSRAKSEYQLPSMDRPDIFFKNRNFGIACEIKSWLSNEDDLLRGIFQCVKYRALLNALNKIKGRSPMSECLLIVQQELPENLQDAANRLRIPVIMLSQKEVGN